MKDGGPADLTARDMKIGVPTTGLALRDYFAGQALAGWLAGLPADSRPRPQIDAELAYKYADAMLKAREESNESE